MSLGFVHGVLNTDNVSISGQAIDFGPCAFIDGFSLDAVYSSIDRAGRYAYRNQPGITQWNLARFAESLLDLIDPDEPNRAVHLATDALEHFEETYRDTHTRLFASKLGIDLAGATEEHWDTTAGLIDRTLALLDTYGADFTGFFRALTDPGTANRDATLAALRRVLDAATATRAVDAEAPNPADWLQELEALRASTSTSTARSDELMGASNPVYIPRNLHLEDALAAAAAGDTAPVLRLLDAVRDPYTRRPGLEDLETAPECSRFFTSFCGT